MVRYTFQIIRNGLYISSELATEASITMVLTTTAR